jgi:sugar/nucleoside kinase (ribokinase family)
MVWVVGAVCVDVVASRESFLEGTSNPSRVTVSLGGVGYRIFSRLAVKKRFITAVGSDSLSAYALGVLEAGGGAAVRVVEAGPPVYVALMEAGRLRIGASDVEAVERGLDLPWVMEQLRGASEGDVLALDGNLSAGLLAGLVSRFAPRLRVVFEPVSVEKARRHRASLGGCWLATPTDEEARALSGDDGPGPLADADALSYIEEAGVRHMLVTRGPRGCLLYSAGRREAFAPERVLPAADTTGAGDLLAARLLDALERGTGMAAAVREGMRAVERGLAEAQL